ncbi:insulinase family protein [Demetria terragena]|uniref:insulinase family protein n=1 Tax=Demetria terragena TaxID=63959 RepID=UPI0003A96B57|nr:insulinase family protein [Demetria terragena]
MQQTLADGVVTLWEDAPGPFSAGLVVGMGASDETFTTSGITHLIEHLVMAQIGRRPINYNANVDIHHSSFVASGDRADVLQFIEDVALHLHAPDTSRIAHEAKVIGIESGTYGPPALAEALRARCGYRGAGLTSAPEPDLGGVSAQAVTELTGRLVRKDGCVLVLTGEPADDVRVPVPDGRPNRADDAPFLSSTTPGAVRGYSEDEVTISFLTPESSEALGMLVTERAFDTLRMRDALSYQIEDHTMALHGHGLTAIGADFAEERAPEVARALRREVQRLVTEPPTEAEVDHVRSQLRHRLEDSTAAFDVMVEEAGRLTRDLPARHHSTRIEAEMAQVQGEEWNRAIAMAQDTMLVHLPLEVWEADDAEQFDDLPFDGRRIQSADEFPTDGEIFLRRRSRLLPRRLAVALTGDTIAMRHGGEMRRAAWSEVVGVAHEGDTRMVVFADGFSFGLRGRDFRRGDKMLAQLDACTADVRFADTDLWLGYFG